MGFMAQEGLYVFFLIAYVNIRFSFGISCCDCFVWFTGLVIKVPVVTLNNLHSVSSECLQLSKQLLNILSQSNFVLRL